VKGETIWQKRIREYEEAHKKEIASGYRMRCPYCGGGTGPSANRKKIGDSHKTIRALCFTCYSMHGRRFVDGRIINGGGEDHVAKAKELVRKVKLQVVKSRSGSKTKDRTVNRRTR
jgi:hypothetical protein